MNVRSTLQMCCFVACFSVVREHQLGVKTGVKISIVSFYACIPHTTRNWFQLSNQWVKIKHKKFEPHLLDYRMSKKLYKANQTLLEIDIVNQ